MSFITSDRNYRNIFVLDKYQAAGNMKSAATRGDDGFKDPYSVS